MPRHQTRLRRRLRKQRKPLGLLIGVIAVIAVLMLAHVKLRVRTTELAQEVDQLRRQRQTLIEERQILFQQVQELSRFGRIQEFARTELGFVFPPIEKVEELDR